MARDLCRKIRPNSVDLVCFPEMAFTGYVFKSASAIRPYLEIPREGPSSRFCSELAKEMKCYVVAGYPEIFMSESNKTEIIQDELTNTTEEISTDEDTFQPIGYNSAIFYGPDGEWVGGYRKTHLFEVDKSWAFAGMYSSDKLTQIYLFSGTGFATFNLPEPLGTISLGICMDLNPQPPASWTLEKGPYEIANYCLKQKSNVLILLNSWLDSGEYPDYESDFHVVQYWAARLRPLWKDADSASENSSENEEEIDGSMHDSNKDIIVIVCNRTGEENGKKFAGTSAILRMIPGSGKPQLLEMMTRTEQDARIFSIQV
ncbi:carbon-nitrogen hydrolase [Cyathus striatus]|nr:carbon-nitrogen hydrolase [Cyathus striatus]